MQIGARVADRAVTADRDLNLCDADFALRIIQSSLLFHNSQILQAKCREGPQSKMRDYCVARWQSPKESQFDGPSEGNSLDRLD